MRAYSETTATTGARVQIDFELPKGTFLKIDFDRGGWAIVAAKLAADAMLLKAARIYICFQAPGRAAGNIENIGFAGSSAFPAKGAFFAVENDHRFAVRIRF